LIATARSEEVHPWSTSVEDTYLVKLHVRALGVFYLVFSSYRSIREVYFSFVCKEKENRMVCLCAKDATKNIVFFQGDIQDDQDSMQRHPIYHEYTKYSLENTATLLFERFRPLKCNVFIIRPSRFESSRSVYECPLRPELATLHLEALLRQGSARLQHVLGFKVDDQLPRILIGFSRGVLMLNRLLSELATAVLYMREHTDPTTKEQQQQEEDIPNGILDWESAEASKVLPSWEPSFRHNIIRHQNDHHFTEKDHRSQENRARSPRVSYWCRVLQWFAQAEIWHWLDGHRFPTVAVVVETARDYYHDLQQSRVSTDSQSPFTCLGNVWIAVHGTPRQLNDPQRTYIRMEHTRFLSLLGKYISAEHIYFEGEPRTLEMHFKVLDKFDTHTQT